MITEHKEEGDYYVNPNSKLLKNKTILLLYICGYGFYFQPASNFICDFSRNVWYFLYLAGHFSTCEFLYSAIH